MAYISSQKIKIFPSIGRNPEIDADAELMNEGNISNIIRSLCRERKSYVLSKTWAAPFEFVIYGFYFKVTDISPLSDRPLYAHITLKENTGNYQLLTVSNSTVSNNSLQILDQEVSQSSQFQGVLFDAVAEGGTHTLQLLDAEGNIPATSLLHTETDEILNKGTSSYISDSFTTSSLNATKATMGTLTVTGTTTLSGNVNAAGQTITASIFEGELAGKLKTARTISLSGDISGNAAFDASADVTINTEIGEGKVGTAELAAGAIISDKVAAGAIISDKVAANAITSDKIAANAITSDKIAEGAIISDKIAEGAITTEKLGFNVTMALTVSDTTLVLSIPKLENN